MGEVTKTRRTLIVPNQAIATYVTQWTYDSHNRLYTYEPARRRLQNLTVNAGGKSIMDNAYAYDAVSNVLSVANKAALPESGKAGGQMAHAYTYDALYRLASASGIYTGADSKTASYRLEMGYDNMHRIVSKKQHLTQQGVQFDGTLHVV